MSDTRIVIPNKLHYQPEVVSKSCSCLFCKMRKVLIQSKYIPWITLARIIFLSLMTIFPQRDYFSVKTDVPDFVHSHWMYLEQLKQFSSGSKWRKSTLDAINHSRYFESGKNEYQVSGYWKLVERSIPYVENWEEIELDSAKAISEERAENVVDSESIERKSIEGSVKSEEVNSSSNGIKNYYSKSINNCMSSINDLHNLLKNSKSDKEFLQSEVKMNEDNIIKYRNALYKVSNVDDEDYSSYSFLIHNVF